MSSISFVGTFYNKSPFVPVVMASLKAQRELPPEVEYIFIDDGSTDDTLAQLRTHSQGLPNVTIISQANQGPAVATNVGIFKAKNHFLKIIDGDDLLHPDLTWVLIKTLTATGAASVYAHGGTLDDVQIYRSFDWAPVLARCTPVTQIPAPIPIPLKKHLKQCIMHPTVMLTRTAVAQAAGGCDTKVFIQDYSLSLRLAAQGPCYRVPLNLAFFPIVGRPTLSDNDLQIVHDLNAVLIHFLQEYRHQLPGHLYRYSVQHGTARALRLAKRFVPHQVLPCLFWRLTSLLTLGLWLKPLQQAQACITRHAKLRLGAQ